MLKRLRGTPIVRHDQAHGMIYAEEPPYEVLQTAAVPFAVMQRMKRFARYWDVVANSGNWTATLPAVLAGPSAYEAFLAFAEWLQATTRATAGIALHRLAGLLWRWLVEHRGADPQAVGAAMAADYARCARHDRPEFLRPFVAPRTRGPRAPVVGAARQARHRGGAAG